MSIYGSLRLYFKNAKGDDVIVILGSMGFGLGLDRWRMGGDGLQALQARTAPLVMGKIRCVTWEVPRYTGTGRETKPRSTRDSYLGAEIRKRRRFPGMLQSDMYSLKGRKQWYSALPFD